MLRSISTAKVWTVGGKKKAPLNEEKRKTEVGMEEEVGEGSTSAEDDNYELEAPTNNGRKKAKRASTEIRAQVMLKPS